MSRKYSPSTEKVGGGLRTIPHLGLVFRVKNRLAPNKQGISKPELHPASERKERANTDSFFFFVFHSVFLLGCHLKGSVSEYNGE